MSGNLCGNVMHTPALQMKKRGSYMTHSQDICSAWRANPNINPATGRRMRKPSTVYNAYAMACAVDRQGKARAYNPAHAYVQPTYAPAPAYPAPAYPPPAYFPPAYPPPAYPPPVFRPPPEQQSDKRIVEKVQPKRTVGRQPIRRMLRTFMRVVSTWTTRLFKLTFGTLVFDLIRDAKLGTSLLDLPRVCLAIVRTVLPADTSDYVQKLCTDAANLVLTKLTAGKNFTASVCSKLKAYIDAAGPYARSVIDTLELAAVIGLFHEFVRTRGARLMKLPSQLAELIFGHTKSPSGPTCPVPTWRPSQTCSPANDPWLKPPVIPPNFRPPTQGHT